MRYKKFYTVKEWKKFKKIKVKEIGDVEYFFDIQEIMCKKFDIILIDYTTKKEKIFSFLKKINFENINIVIDTLNKDVKDFSNSMDKLSKEIVSSEIVNIDKDRKNFEKLWEKHEEKSKVKIWSDSPKINSQKTKDEINLEKLWGFKK